MKNTQKILKDFLNMKRLLWLTNMLLILTMLFSACTPVADPGTNSTGESTESTEYTGTSENNDGSGQTVESAAEKYQKLLTKNYWYWRALGCVFEKPEDISAEYFFHMGLELADREQPGSFSDEEKAFLVAQSEIGGYNNFKKLPVAKMNEALSVLNITVDDLALPDSFIYYDKTDSYYVHHTDAYGIVGVTVTEAVENLDGTVQVYWETKEMHLNTTTGEYWPDGAKMVSTLQKMDDGTYRFLSNIPVQ